jgi:hypothetical protein
MQVKIRRTTVNTEEKFDVISRLEKGDRFVDIHRNVRLARGDARTIAVITESAKSGITVFV